MSTETEDAAPDVAGTDATDIAKSNSLADLAARIRIEHEATDAALKSSVEHAMAAGDLLIEAKAQVPHGQWLPWLTDHCAMSERTAQLYMRIAKNRETIESQIRNGVADLTLGQAAALMMMTADMKKVLDFVKQVETTDDPEKIVNLCIEHGVGYIHDPGYDMFANCTEEEKREWHVFILFLVKHEGAVVDGGVAEHVEWVLQKQFKNVEEWLGPEGNKFCWWRNPIKAEFIEVWRAFAAEHASLSIADINAELGRIEAYQRANPQPAIKTKRRRRG